MKPDDTIHLIVGNNKFVRCQVGENLSAVPIALVGTWELRDLPHRTEEDGVYWPYFPDIVEHHRVIFLNENEVYELNETAQKSSPNLPSEMEPIDYRFPLNWHFDFPPPVVTIRQSEGLRKIFQLAAATEKVVELITHHLNTTQEELREYLNK